MERLTDVSAKSPPGHMRNRLSRPSPDGFSHVHSSSICVATCALPIVSLRPFSACSQNLCSLPSCVPRLGRSHANTSLPINRDSSFVHHGACDHHGIPRGALRGSSSELRCALRRGGRRRARRSEDLGLNNASGDHLRLAAALCARHFRQTRWPLLEEPNPERRPWFGRLTRRSTLGRTSGSGRARQEPCGSLNIGKLVRIRAGRNNRRQRTTPQRQRPGETPHDLGSTLWIDRR